MDKVGAPLREKLDEAVPATFQFDELDIVWNKAIIEISGTGQ
jgi:hypothetical protein